MQLEARVVSNADFRMILIKLKMLLELLRMKVIICVEKSDEITMGCSDAGIPGSRQAFVLAVCDAANSRIIKLRNHFVGVVGRAVIHHNHFKIRKGLIQEALNRLSDKFSLVIGRDDDAEHRAAQVAFS